MAAAPLMPDGERAPAGFVVNEFQFQGNTVFSSEKLSAITTAYTNRPISGLDLEEARMALTRLYITNGHINSGAVLTALPTNGIVTYTIVEGTISEVRVQGNRWTAKSFYETRLRASAGEPLNVNRLHSRLQMWRDIYPLEQINAELKPGIKPGEAILDAKVKERFPYRFGVQYANDKPPSTGPEQVTALIRADSLTGRGDTLALDYGIARSKGAGMDGADFLGADDLAASYAIPVTAHDTTFGAQYVRSSAAIVEAPFDELDIRSESAVYGLSVTQPIIRVPNHELSLTLSAERKSNQSWLLGVPYSFSDGAVDGKSVVSALRLSGQFVDRSIKHVFAARLTVSGGLDVLDATMHSSGPDGRFVSFLGQTHYLRRLGNTRNEVMFKLVGQYTPDPLLALEQLSMGGANTVRGYRENTLVRDVGCVGTLEFHVPLWLDKQDRPKLQAVPFYSHGAGWNNERQTPSPIDISSAGIGLVFTPCQRMEASIFWGHGFRNIRQNNHDIQDDGIHFRLNLWAF